MDLFGQLISFCGQLDTFYTYIIVDLGFQLSDSFKRNRSRMSRLIIALIMLTNTIIDLIEK